MNLQYVPNINNAIESSVELKTFKKKKRIIEILHLRFVPRFCQTDVLCFGSHI